MKNNDGRLNGPSQAEPVVSALRASVPDAKKRKILRDLDKAREGLFPHKTCPASRHVHMIVEGLLDTKAGYGADLKRLGYEPDHLAGSIASVLQNLWDARRWMRWQPNIEGDLMSGGKWVPDLDAIAAQGIEAGTVETERLDRDDDEG